MRLVIILGSFNPPEPAGREASDEEDPKRPHKHEDPTKDGFWYPPYNGP